MNTNLKPVEDEIDEALENEIAQEYKEKKVLPPLPKGVPGYLIGPSVGTRVNREEWGLLLFLKRHYRVDQVSEALRMAIYDAVTLAQQENETNTGEHSSSPDEDQRYNDLTERLDRLTSTLETALKRQEQEINSEEEIEEAPPEESPYDPQVIARFRNLDNEGKKYLAGRLRANPNARSIGTRYPDWKREIDTNIHKIAPYLDGRKGSRQAASQARRKLHDYLVKERILDK